MLNDIIYSYSVIIQPFYRSVDLTQIQSAHVTRSMVHAGNHAKPLSPPKCRKEKKRDGVSVNRTGDFDDPQKE